jgi:hypothetical protein
MRSTCQRLLFRERGLGLVLRMVRQVARVFQDGFAINPYCSCHCKGRGTISQALCDFRPLALFKLGPTNPCTAAPRPFQACFGAFGYLLRLDLRQRTQDRQQGVPDELVVGVEVRFRLRVEFYPIAVEALQVHDRLHHPLAGEAVQRPEQHDIELAAVCILEQPGELCAALGVLPA